MSGPIRKSPEERFWKWVQKAGPDDCWIFTGGKNGPDNYGRFRTGGRHDPYIGAHRFAYELAFGPIPDGLLICHRCDTPRCVNPKHLFTGDKGDNARDATAKGRMKGLFKTGFDPRRMGPRTKRGRPNV